MISIEFNQLLNYYENSRDISSSKIERNGRSNNDDHERFFINLGHNKGLNKGGLLRLICSNTDLPSQAVGAIDLYNDFSFFEVEKSLSEKILSGLKDKEYDDNSFVVEIAAKDAGGGKRKRDNRSRGSDRNRDRNRNRNSSRSGGGGNRRRR
jgi:ATP-dependent RNA helicase DeaD